MKKLEYIFSLINSIFAYLFGGFDTLITTLIIFIVLDYITGVCKGIYRKELNSKKGLKGIIKKIGYLFIIILASLFDKITNNTDGTIRTITIYFFYFKWSYFNIGKLGSNGPSFTKKTLKCI